MTKFLLALIFLLALTLRLYHLGTVPPGLHRDEASLGYNAYSLLATGKDEYARPYPLALESFGDWKLPLYSFLSIISLKFFPLTSFSVRLLSAVSGSLSVIFIYLLTARLFASRRLVLLSSLFFALLPWNIFFSHAAYEANLSLSLFLLGFYLLLTRFSWLGFIPLALTLLTYHSAHIFTPLFLILFFLIKRPKLSSIFLVSGLTFCFFYGIMFLSNLKGDSTKISGIGIFSDRTALYYQVELPRQQDHNGLFPTFLVHNKYLFMGNTLLENYLTFFSPQFLVTQGGTNLQHNLPHLGNLTLFDYLFFFAGLLFLFRHPTQRSKLIMLWLLLSPVAASLTRDAPHYTRSVYAAGVIPLLTAVGVVTLLRKFPLAKFPLTVAFLLYFLTFLDSFFVHFPTSGQIDWNNDELQLSRSVLSQAAGYRYVAITRPDYSPYIFLLFQSQTPPQQFQNSVVRYPSTSEGFVHVKNWGKYYFPTKIDLEALCRQSSPTGKIKVLLVDTAGSICPLVSEVVINGQSRYKLTAVNLSSDHDFFSHLTFQL